ncbi:Fic family protein [Flavobacterium sp. CG_23.5]|uniref:Fic family protein n=1 Tax=Flavobacterium sp. CG_23.5 TaxID=2760708 RepID=UPI001AE11195|nr:Fic family protein [Flavobacterium sp. CG_23.5]MBP2281689.1 Fic family protein [Flavobacterium sp. CG_23.5]
MLPDYLQHFNEALQKFQEKFPREKWSPEFKDSLINNYSFYSARIEDDKLHYGDTIKFLNNELVRVGKMTSLLNISNHKDVMKSLLDKLEDFQLTEEIVKGIHQDLMGSDLAWEVEFKPELIANYRNIPTVGSREPFFENKEYAPHYNLAVIMASHMGLFNNRFERIDNSNEATHILSVLAYFHNTFLNKIHPFADGNGRVCRIIMGAIMMQYNCPPIFPLITDEEHQFEYISTIVKCELENSDDLLVRYFAKGMSESLLQRVYEF